LKFKLSSELGCVNCTLSVFYIHETIFLFHIVMGPSLYEWVRPPTDPILMSDQFFKGQYRIGSNRGWIDDALWYWCI